MTPRASVRDERGAVSSLVVMLFATFVITGLLAWSVDAGQVVWERRQTQNAADAAALALAQSCARGNCEVDADGLPALVQANTVNLGARQHTIQRQCKRNTTLGLLPLCTSPLPTDVAQLRECPPLPPGVSTLLPHVEVRVRADEGTAEEIPNPLSRINPDPNAPPTSEILSCSRAAWGIPTSGSFTAPITISTCEWNTFSSGGTIYHAPPAGAWPGYGGAGQPAFPAAPTTPNTPGHEIVIKLHNPADGECPAGPSGGDAPGGFGYLSTTAPCTVTTTTTNGVDYWASVSVGSAPLPCRPVMADIRDNGPTMDLPVFDCIVNGGSGPVTPSMDCNSGSGSLATYHLAGIARFYLSGYRLTGGETRPSRVTGAVPCSAPVTCISGWFVSGVLSSASGPVLPPSPSAPGFGLSAVIAAG